MLDEAKLNQFMGQMLADLGGAGSIAMVRMGDNLGLYKTLHAKGPMTVELPPPRASTSVTFASGHRIRRPRNISLTMQRRRNSP